MARWARLSILVGIKFGFGLGRLVYQSTLA